MSSFIRDHRPSIDGRASVMIPPRTAYSFPLLKLADIILCLKELGINITEDEMQSPDKYKDQIRRLFENLIEICTGITKEELNQPAFSGLSMLNFPELHEDSVPQLNTLRACQNMMEVCGIQDFTFKDYISPTSKRLRRQLSGIINFAKFREERLSLLNDLTSNRDSLIDQLNKVRVDNDELNNRLASLRSQCAEEAKLVVQVEGECKEVEVRISNLNHNQAEIREQSSELKSLSNQLKEKISSATLNLEEVEATKRRLQGQIVHSPAKFKKQITDVAQALLNEQSELKSNERKLRELNSWRSAADEALTFSHNAIEYLKSYQHEVEELKNLRSELQKYQSKALDGSETSNKLNQQIQQLSRQSQRAEDKLTQLRKQSVIRNEEYHQITVNLQMQLEQAEELRSQARYRAEKQESEAKKMEREASSQKLLFEKEHTEMMNTYYHLEKTVISHLQQMRVAIEDDSLPSYCV